MCVIDEINLNYLLCDTLVEAQKFIYKLIIIWHNICNKKLIYAIQETYITNESHLQLSCQGEHFSEVKP